MGLRIVKAMQHTYTGGGSFPVAYILRFMYEFWGYVVHAPSTTTTPGGFPSSSYTTFPTNALEGTLVVSTGTDGVTTADQLTFDSAAASFAASIVGKYLVVWDSSNPTAEDGIYKITGRPSATRLTLNVTTGGVPNPTTLRPRFTTRSSLKYRVVDIDNIGSLAWVAGQFLVFQMTPSISNTGQANSQIQVYMKAATGGQTVGLVGSPAGTWAGAVATTIAAGSNGQSLPQPTINVAATAGFPSSGIITVFTGGAQTPQQVSYTGVTGTTFTGCSGGTGSMATNNVVTTTFTDALAEVTHVSNSGGLMSTGSTTTTAVVSIFGDKDGMVVWFKNSNAASASYFHMEAPQRLASQAQDPNPLMMGCDGLQTLTVTTFGQAYNTFFMAGTDGVMRRHRMLVKCLSGDGNGEVSRPTATMSAFGDTRIAISPPLNKTFLSKILLGNVGTPSSQFCLARAAMRYARMCPNVLPPWTRIGDSGEWLHIQNGVCFPWDNTVLGANLIPLGY